MPGGVKVLRYEIKNIRPPQDVLAAMEKQMRAEREKRAMVLSSEGIRDSKINEAEGEKQEVIKRSGADQLKQVNEADGQASAILALANATAEGIRSVASALNDRGGDSTKRLRIAELYIDRFGELAKEANTLVIPANLSDIASMISLATKITQDRPRPAERSESAPG